MRTYLVDVGDQDGDDDGSEGREEGGLEESMERVAAGAPAAPVELGTSLFLSEAPCPTNAVEDDVGLGPLARLRERVSGGEYCSKSIIF